MDAIRARIGSAFEWLVAAAFLLATIGVGSLIVREMRAIVMPRASAAATPAAAVPATIPARAISIPILIFSDGKQIRIGDTLLGVGSLLGRSAEVGTEHVDQGPRGPRVTRFYDHAGTRFILVFEPVGQPDTAKVSAIYLQ
jgi:hypothetical protein